MHAMVWIRRRRASRPSSFTSVVETAPCIIHNTKLGTTKSTVVSTWVKRRPKMVSGYRAPAYGRSENLTPFTRLSFTIILPESFNRETAIAAVPKPILGCGMKSRFAPWCVIRLKTIRHNIILPTPGDTLGKALP